MSLRPDYLFDVSGKVVVITGGGTGIGLMMATALENNGATVFLLGRRLDILEKASSTNAKHGKMIPIRCDVTCEKQLLSAAKKIEADTGYIDVLVNNSGIFKNNARSTRRASDVKDFQEKLWKAGTSEDFMEALDVNVKALYYTTVVFLSLLDAGNRRHTSMSEPSSQVITISSYVGASTHALGLDELVNSLSYSSSKAAATHLGKTFASLLARWEIRSNVIEPGFFPSEMSTWIVKNYSSPSQSVSPAKRLGSVEDMAGLTLFLVSRAGGYMNGSVLLMDGGRLAKL